MQTEVEGFVIRSDGSGGLRTFTLRIAPSGREILYTPSSKVGADELEAAMGPPMRSVRVMFEGQQITGVIPI